jgi:hypothetical protein
MPMLGVLVSYNKFFGLKCNDLGYEVKSSLEEPVTWLNGKVREGTNICVV